MATILVMSGGAPKEVFALLVPQFERESGHKVGFTYAVITAIKDKLAAGEKADVLVMPVPVLEGYAKDGKIRGDARVTFGTVGLSMVVRESAPKPDISTPDKLREAMRSARAIVHATPGQTPSGSHVGKLVEQFGIAPNKVVHRPALDGGVQLVAKGEAELGIYPTSEVVNIDGLTVAGALPKELQLNIVYGAAVTADSANAGPAGDLIKFLSDPANRRHWTRAGFDPPGR